MRDRLKIRRALITVSDKSGVQELGKALHDSGAEIVATGNTARVLQESGIPITPIEKISGSPEAFQGRMKTLSFPVCSGILYRRGDEKDEADLKKLSISPIDCVVVNFYPFEQAAAKPGTARGELIEQIDIGGPTLVRSAAKNAPETLVLTSPAQYGAVLSDLEESGTVSHELAYRFASEAWERILQYDQAIADELGTRACSVLRYGENPHQKAFIEFDREGPIAWPVSKEEALTPNELSYNNILDLSAAYALASDLSELAPDSTGVVIVKHNNPCGVALVPGAAADAQLKALEKAWEGDPVSAFGGVLVFTHALEKNTAQWLKERFVELVAAPELEQDSEVLRLMLEKRKKLKAVCIRRFGEMPRDMVVSVPGGKLHQTPDSGIEEEFKSVTERAWPAEKQTVSGFGVAVCRALKSNAIALVREGKLESGEAFLQLVGAGQGQPNRIEALEKLAVPRAREVLSKSGGELSDCVMVSDAFFPFRDTVETSAKNGIRWIIQPGGSIKDEESISACNEHGVAMAFTGVRHFRH